MQHSKSNARLLLVITGLGVFLFIFLFYCFIAYYNRYQTDDLAFTAKINEMGFFAAIRDFFLNWEANLSSVLLFLFLDFFQDKNLLFLNGGIFLSNILCFWFLLSRLVNRNKIVLKKTEEFVIAAFIIALFYTSTRAGGGVIYWSTAQIAYFIPLNFLFIGLGYWIAAKEKQSIAAAAFFLFLFAHSRINYDASFAIVYAVFFILFFLQTKKINFRLQLPFLFFMVGVLTYLLVPGVYKRIAFHQEGSSAFAQPHTLFYYVRSSIIGIVHFYKMAVLNTSFWFVLAVAFFCGSLFVSFFNKLFTASVSKRIILLIIAFNAALVMHVFIILFALKTPIGYGRVFVFIEFMWFILIILLGLFAGSKFKIVAFSKIMLIVIICIYLFFGWQKNLQALSDAKLFAKQHDERIEYLKQLKEKGSRSTVYLPALKGTEVFGYEDIQKEDTMTHIIPYPNYSLQQYYRLPFMVFLEK